MSLELRPYQLQHLQFHLSHDRSINCLLPGRGKSPIFCCYSKIQYDCFKEKSVFVMPTALLAKNKEELLKWTEWKDEEVVIMNQTKGKRDKAYKDSKIKAFLMSGDMFAKEWRLLPKDVGVVVIDEMHAIFGNTESARTQSLYVASRRFKKILMCTGTPVAGKFSTFYPIVALINPKFYLNYRNFMSFHGIFNDFNQIVAWKNGDRIRKILEIISSGTKDPFADRKDLKEIIFEKCNFDPIQKEAYKEMEEDALLQLEDTYLQADSGGTKQIRCRQILSCPESIGLKIDSNGKDEMLKLHLSNAKEMNQQIVIFSNFVAEQERIKKLCDSLGVKSEILNGSVSSEKRGKIDAAFRNHELDVIIGSQKVASVGYNWENASFCIFIASSISFDNSEFEQAYSRLSRGTRKTPLLIYVLTNDTKVERRVFAILQRKSNELKTVFGTN